MSTMIWLAVVTQTWIREDGQLMIDEYNYGAYTTPAAAKADLDLEIERITDCHANWVAGEIATNAVSVSVLKVYLDQQHAGNEVCRRTNTDGIWSEWKPVAG